MVTNIPAPYRVPVYNLLAQDPGIELRVFYAAHTEPDRQWDLPPLAHEHEYLDGRLVERQGRFIHYNPDIWGALTRFRPQVVITTGYNPTHLMAVAYAVLNGAAHVVMTDGTQASEARLSPVHRLVRHLVFAFSRSFAVASHGGFRLLRGFGVPKDRIHFSPLCANTTANWSPDGSAPRDIDLLFSGRLAPVKNGGFALRVAQGVAQRLGRPVTMAFLGSGPQEGDLRALADTLGPQVQVQFVGHVTQGDLPGWYRRSRIFLFPSLWDPWGVVANEAALAGVPVIVSPHAGAAGEIVRDGVSGHVLPLEVPLWVDAATQLLQDPALHQRFQAAGLACVAPFSMANAAAGMADATRQAVGITPPLPESRFVRRPRVVCVQRRLPHYREALFRHLRDNLEARGIEFVLVHGDASPAELSKGDSGRLTWARKVPCRYLAGGRLVWQPLRDELVGADLVIVTQENSLIYNLALMTVRRPPRLAYWGHGRNFQAQRPQGLSERLKRLLATRVDWWFAYTGLTARYLQSLGFPAEHICTVKNAVDTSALARQCATITAQDVQDFRARHLLGDGPIGLYIGSLYPEKRIPFLLQAAQALAQQVPGFRLVVVGNGPDAALVKAAATQHPWLRFLGAQYGRDKAVCLRAAQLLLNPGLVGLGILDAFVAGLPMVTTDCHLHSPEIDYLRHGENGLMTADELGAFVSACADLLTRPDAHRRLSEGAARDAALYTIETMSENMAEGIARAVQVLG